MMKNKDFMERLCFSLAGLKAAWRSERSFRTQVVFAIAVIPLLLVLRPSPVWWALVAIVCFLVLAVELINTALEHLVDHLHPEQHPNIKIVKDCAAAAVLLLSIAALCVAAAMVFSVFWKL
jgi:diacylglycerol kinase (ATP)